MNFLQNLFGGTPSELEDLQTLFLSKAINPLDQKYLACFSLLLVKVANADNKVTDGERAKIKELLVKHAQLSPAQAEVASTVALKKSLAPSLEVKTICTELLTCADLDRLKNVMRACLYVASDDGISDTEIQRMHAIARQLGFSFKDWQEVLSEFKEKQAG